MCGSDGTFDSMGEGMFYGFDGTVMVKGVCANVARICSEWVSRSLLRLTNSQFVLAACDLLL